MPDLVALRGSRHISAVFFDVREPRIYIRFKADMRAKMRRLLLKYKYDYPSNFKERAVESALHRTELLAGAGAT
ncbi:hypothetical protein [Acidithrix sp. C25]|uniref:hypothetical protein n=1 Tax=Acidithrix sp. C25 TaxID=1671482 RepID=UPI00191BA7E9|nr:hypothetical protein [Acidithrix sp. C25]